MKKLPKYRRHSTRDIAFVCIAGKRIYLPGKYNSKESLQAYDKACGELLISGAVSPKKDTGELVLSDLVARYKVWAEDYYKGSDKLSNYQRSADILASQFGPLPVREFRPRCLVRVQDWMIEQDYARTYINETVARIKRIFSWAAVREYEVSGEQLTLLKEVDNLRAGRTSARETTAVQPVDDERVEATIPFLPPAIADMVRFIRACGCRPCEARIVRPIDIDRSGDIWVYTPSTHKTQHRGKLRFVPLGPTAQKILAPRLFGDPTHYCFSSDKQGKRSYTKSSLVQAITRACDKAKIQRWSANQLRHAAATEIRRETDVETARVVLGHTTVRTTEVYAERDLAKAKEVARKLG